MIPFKTAILRKPGLSFANGITTSNLGKPDFVKTLLQHTLYTEALINAGLSVRMLKADENFPDGTFVEDTAVVTNSFALICMPGADTRRGEIVETANVLTDFLPIERIKGDARIDGGDVMQAGKTFFVGLSGRTNREGFEQFSTIVKKYGYESKAVEVEGMLHLKSGVNYIGFNRLVAVKSIANHSAFAGYEIIEVDNSEAYAANCLMVNNQLLIAKGFPELHQKLNSLGYTIIQLDMSEFQKMDGGLSCLSLRF